jgi:hypothetical protein
MSPLKKGPGTIRYNVNELTKGPIESPARKKAIVTLMKKHNISHADAVMKQALAIAKYQARKR